MKLIVKNQGRIVEVKCHLLFNHYPEDDISQHELTPVDGEGFALFRNYQVTDEGFNLTETLYNFRDGSWYMDVSYDGRDCDGCYSSFKEYKFNGLHWVQLGKGYLRDLSAEAMGY